MVYLDGAGGFTDARGEEVFKFGVGAECGGFGDGAGLEGFVADCYGAAEAVLSAVAEDAQAAGAVGKDDKVNFPVHGPHYRIAAGELFGDPVVFNDIDGCARTLEDDAGGGRLSRGGGVRGRNQAHGIRIAVFGDECKQKFFQGEMRRAGDE